MINVYIAVITFAILFAIGQVRAGESSPLNTYYLEFATPAMSDDEKRYQSRTYPGCKPFGDNLVGYFKTEEEYKNAYDPAILAVD